MAAFDADPASCSHARGFVREALGNVGVDPQLIEQAVLVASELVTNAVLHAQAGPVVTVHTNSDLVRLEVEDSSEVFPLLRNYGGDAVTGRGLAVVDASATWWGVDATETGKSVWAEFSRSDKHLKPSPPRTMVHSTHRFAPQEPNDFYEEEEHELIEVQFVAVPVDIYLALEQHNEALLREFELLAIDAEAGNASPLNEDTLSLASEARQFVQLHTNAYRNVVHTAFTAGQTHVNLRSTMPADSMTQLDAYSAVMKRAERLALDGTLLTAAATPPVLALRDWFFIEMRRQLVDRLPAKPAPSFADQL